VQQVSKFQGFKVSMFQSFKVQGISARSGTQAVIFAWPSVALPNPASREGLGLYGFQTLKPAKH
jgi:hypothetical protein